MEMRFKIFRFDPELDREPRYQDYVVSARPEERILDCLNRIRWEQDGTLAYRMSCAHGVCGSDGMKINGRCALACQKLVTDYLQIPPTPPLKKGGRGDLPEIRVQAEHESGEKAHVVLEPLPFFPVVKDLIVDRSALDRIIVAGGFVSVPTGSAPDGNAIPVPKENAEIAMDAAACIGCGACVAACPNASAMLFTAAKVSQLALLPQGQPERWLRVRKMVAAMDEAGFGNCTNHGECEAACPKGIHIGFIARMNRDYLKASLFGAEESKAGDGAA